MTLVQICVGSGCDSGERFTSCRSSVKRSRLHVGPIFTSGFVTNAHLCASSLETQPAYYGV